MTYSVADTPTIWYPKLTSAVKSPQWNVSDSSDVVLPSVTAAVRENSAETRAAMLYHCIGYGNVPASYGPYSWAIFTHQCLTDGAGPPILWALQNAAVENADQIIVNIEWSETETSPAATWPPTQWWIAQKGTYPPTTSAMNLAEKELWHAMMCEWKAMTIQALRDTYLAAAGFDPAMPIGLWTQYGPAGLVKTWKSRYLEPNTGIAADVGGPEAGEYPALVDMADYFAVPTDKVGVSGEAWVASVIDLHIRAISDWCPLPIHAWVWSKAWVGDPVYTVEHQLFSTELYLAVFRKLNRIGMDKICLNIAMYGEQTDDWEDRTDDENLTNAVAQFIEEG